MAGRDPARDPGHWPGHRRQDRRTADYRPPGILRAITGPGACRCGVPAPDSRRGPQDGQAALGGAGVAERGRGGGSSTVRPIAGAARIGRQIGGPDPGRHPGPAPAQRPDPSGHCLAGSYLSPGGAQGQLPRGAGRHRRRQPAADEIDHWRHRSARLLGGAGCRDARLCCPTAGGRGAAQRPNQDDGAAAQWLAGGSARDRAPSLGRGAAVFHRQPGTQHPHPRDSPKARAKPE